MKRFFGVIAAIALTVSALCVSVFAAPMTANNNLCKAFDETVGHTINDYLVGNSVDKEHTKIYDGYGFARYVVACLQKEMDLSQYKKPRDEHDPLSVTIYRIPYSLFIEKAGEIADFDGDFKDEYLYDQQGDCIEIEMYDFWPNLGHPVHVIGYRHISGDRYVVYAQAMQIDMDSVEDIKREFAEYYEDDLENHIFYCYNGKYHLVHENCFFIADITFRNGTVFYNGLQEVESLGDIEYIKKDDVVPEEDVNLNTDKEILISNADAFPGGTTVYGKRVLSGSTYDRAKAALSGVKYKDFLVYEFEAIKDNEAVQPRNTVFAEITLPGDFALKGAKMYYLNADGKLEPTKTSTDSKTRKMVAALDHFSTYIVVNDKDATIPEAGYGNEGIVLAMSCAVFCISAFSLLLIGKKTRRKV